MWNNVLTYRLSQFQPHRNTNCDCPIFFLEASIINLAIRKLFSFQARCRQLTNETRFRGTSLIRTMSSLSQCVSSIFCWQPVQVGRGHIEALSQSPHQICAQRVKKQDVQNHLTKAINSGFGSLYESYQSTLVSFNTTLVSNLNSKETC